MAVFTLCGASKSPLVDKIRKNTKKNDFDAKKFVFCL